MAFISLMRLYLKRLWALETSRLTSPASAISWLRDTHSALKFPGSSALRYLGTTSPQMFLIPHCFTMKSDLSLFLFRIGSITLASS